MRTVDNSLGEAVTSPSLLEEAIEEVIHGRWRDP